MVPATLFGIFIWLFPLSPATDTMNSSEQKNFEQDTPTSDEIKYAVEALSNKAAQLDISLTEDAALIEGYQEAIDILQNDKRTYDQISVHLKTDQAKVIAVKAVDYLNGTCSQKLLLNSQLIR
jgi:uncharacterized protein YgiM (DUF1202 family)